MASYEKILGLVGEVRDILELHEAKKKGGKSKSALGAAFNKQMKAGEEKAKESAKADKKWHKKVRGKFKQGTAHNPFSWLKKGKRLGPAVRGDDRHPGKKRGYWSCRCHGYKCLCKGTEGEKKRVTIDRGYKKKYNRDYRKWRARHASKYAPGKGSKFKKRGKKKAG